MIDRREKAVKQWCKKYNIKMAREAAERRKFLRPKTPPPPIVAELPPTEEEQLLAYRQPRYSVYTLPVQGQSKPITLTSSSKVDVLRLPRKRPQKDVDVHHKPIMRKKMIVSVQQKEEEETGGVEPLRALSPTNFDLLDGMAITQNISRPFTSSYFPSKYEPDNKAKLKRGLPSRVYHTADGNPLMLWDEQQLFLIPKQVWEARL